MGFYDEMADVVAEVLAPESEGGFGQGTVTLTRETDTATPVEAGKPWLGFTKTSVTYTLDAVVRPVEDKFVDGSTILATDRQVSAADFGVEPEPGDVLSIDSKTVTILKQMRLPAAGTLVCWQWIVRG